MNHKSTIKAWRQRFLQNLAEIILMQIISYNLHAKPTMQSVFIEQIKIYKTSKFYKHDNDNNTCLHNQLPNTSIPS